jgi:hypothetical protein
MKRAAASRYLICAVIFGATLCLPWGNLAAVSAPQVGCPHCQATGPGLASGQCCCPAGMPGHCGACGSGSLLTCRCGAASFASISALDSGTPAWQVCAYVHPQVIVASKLFIPNIFHPPESSHFPSQI